MVERKTIARPYAKAVFELAEQSKTYEKWSQVLNVLAQISENPEMRNLLKDKTIAWQDMANFFLSVSEKILDEIVRNFILVLASCKRLEILSEIRSLYETMRAEKEGIVEVQFISSILLNEEEKEGFKRLLERYLSRTVRMHCDVDNSLMGGFIARTGNYVIDGSIRGQLANLKVVMGD